MSRLQPLKTFIQFSQFLPARPQPQSLCSGRLCAGRTSENPPPFQVPGRNHVSYIPLEIRAILLNLLKNNDLMACASGRLPEIFLRGRQGTHACSIQEDPCLRWQRLAGRIYFSWMMLRAERSGERAAHRYARRRQARCGATGRCLVRNCITSEMLAIVESVS
jgi:hypothetical protein